MATHISCHTNECLPNQFPPPRPTLRDYGNVMLSDYEKGHVMLQSTPTIQTDIEGGTTFPSDDDVEPLPFFRRRAPVAEQHCYKDSIMDSALCITPEKSLKSRKTSPQRKGPSCLKNTSNEMKSTRVRFDQAVTIKHMSPEENNDSGIIEIDRTGDVERELEFYDEDEFSDESSGSDLDCSDTVPKTFTFSSVGTDSDRITNIITQTDELNLSISSDIDSNIDTIETQEKRDKVVSPILRKIARPSRPKYKPDLSENDVIVVKPQKMASCKTALMGSGTVEHMLARPEFNSTLFMSKEVQELTKQEMNVPSAVAEVLKSEKNRTKLQEQASIRVNQDLDQFSGLVSVDVKEDDLLETVERQMSAKVKRTHRTKQPRPEDIISRPPDIMDFFTPDLQREVPSFHLHNIPAPADSLTQAAPLSAFDVYQQVRAWEEW